MSKEKLKALFLKPEDKTWVRVADTTAVLLGTFGVGVLFFVLPLNIESTLLKMSFWCAILSMPVLAHALYRNTNLSRMERLALLALVLSSVIALMVASFEVSKNM